MAQSSELASGAGFRFEDQVGGYYPRRSSSQRLGLGDRLTDPTGSEGLDVLPSMEAIYFLGTRSGARSTRYSHLIQPRMPPTGPTSLFPASAAPFDIEEGMVSATPTGARFHQEYMFA